MGRECLPDQGMGDEGRPNCYVGLGEERRRDSRIIQEGIDSLLLQDGSWLGSSTQARLVPGRGPTPWRLFHRMEPESGGES